MRSLAAGGVTEVVLALGFRPDAFRDAYPSGTCAGVPLRYAVEPEPLDTGGAIAFAARAAGIDETFVVVNGDVLTDLDVRGWWSSTGSAAARRRSTSPRSRTRRRSASWPPTRMGGCNASWRSRRGSRRPAG